LFPEVCWSLPFVWCHELFERWEVPRSGSMGKPSSFFAAKKTEKNHRTLTVLSIHLQSTFSASREAATPWTRLWQLKRLWSS
jgi:hypothetical protein